MTNVLNKLRWSIRHRGLLGSLQAGAKSLGRRINPQPEQPPHPFDAQHGTDTGGLITGADLASGHPNDRFIEGYAGAPPSRFRAIIARWQKSGPPNPISAYTFIDVGCGKGRAVLLASELGFCQAVGVELNPELAATAQTNANLWLAAGKAACPIRIEQGDATEFAWPQGPCVVFFYNPFGTTVMQRVVERMSESFGTRPSDLEILYDKPEQAATFAGSFQLIWNEAVPISPEDLAVDPVADPNDQTRAYRLAK